VPSRISVNGVVPAMVKNAGGVLDDAYALDHETGPPAR